MRSSYTALSVLLAVLVVSAAMPASAHINLLQNPGFETGDFPPWDIDGGGDWDHGLASPGHTGRYYAWIWTGSEGTALLWQEIDPPRCAEYLEFYYTGDDCTVVADYSDGTEHTEEIPGFHPWPSWILIHVDLDTKKLVEEVELLTAAGGGFAVDDFDLEACTAPADGGVPVGGVLTPVNALALFAPWLAVIGLVGCIGTLVVVAKKRRH